MDQSIYIIAVVSMLLFAVNPSHFKDLLFNVLKTTYAFIAIITFALGFYFPPFFIPGIVMLFDQHNN